MSILPSYADATTKPHWLTLVLSYVNFGDLKSLCRVCQRAWKLCAPKLWENLLRSIRLLGLRPDDDVIWWTSFVFHKLPNVSLTTRRLVRILDARGFAKASYAFSSDEHDKSLQQSFRRAISLLPNLSSVILDGQEDLDATFLVDIQTPTPPYESSFPSLLSITHSASRLPNIFFTDAIFRDLVYLDASQIPGSAIPLTRRNILPALRVLKLRGRGVDTATLKDLLVSFKLRLWSLDVSFNLLNDEIVDIIKSCSISPTSLRSDAHLEVEGEVQVGEYGSPIYGSFSTIIEASTSKLFNHPERFYADAPVYQVEQESTTENNPKTGRSDGRAPVRKNSLDNATRALLGNDLDNSALDWITTKGLTHLDLSDTLVSSFAIERLLRESGGHLENLSFSAIPLLLSRHTLHPEWPRKARLYGNISMTNVLRPAFASNLQVLSVHHSLVTHIPTLRVQGWSNLTCDYLSEASILPRADAAYSQRWIPDMNPRIQRLTLTCIPRRSSGPLIQRLVHFLRLLSVQEGEIQAIASASLTRKGPGMLKGLRHLTLEFDPDFVDDELATTSDLDVGSLLESGDRGFTFFEDERFSLPSTAHLEEAPSVAEPSNISSNTNPEAPSEHNEELIDHHAEWNGKPFTIPVWIAPSRSTPGSFLHSYRRLVLTHNIKDGVGPASPSQVSAGAPEGSYLFHIAWCAAIMPANLSPPISWASSSMKDVLGELKAYRVKGRAAFTRAEGRTAQGCVELGGPHFFWTGKLEIVTLMTRRIPK